MCLLRAGHQDLTCSSLVTNFSPTLGGISKQREAEWYGDPGSMPLVPSFTGPSPRQESVIAQALLRAVLEGGTFLLRDEISTGQLCQAC